MNNSYQRIIEKVNFRNSTEIRVADVAFKVFNVKAEDNGSVTIEYQDIEKAPLYRTVRFECLNAFDIIGDYMKHVGSDSNDDETIHVFMKYL